MIYGIARLPDRDRLPGITWEAGVGHDVGRQLLEVLRDQAVARMRDFHVGGQLAHSIDRRIGSFLHTHSRNIDAHDASHVGQAPYPRAQHPAHPASPRHTLRADSSRSARWPSSGTCRTAPTQPLSAIRRSIFRPRCDPSKNSQTHKGCQLALMRIRTALFEKYTPGSQFWHKNRGVPRGTRGSGSVSGLPECATWGFLPRGSRRPAASSQAEALSVGYLSFRARISHSRCTFARKNKAPIEYQAENSCPRGTGPTSAGSARQGTRPTQRRSRA